MIRAARLAFYDSDLIYAMVIHRDRYCAECHEYRALREHDGRTYW